MGCITYVLTMFFNNCLCYKERICSTLCPGNRKSWDILDEPPLQGHARKGVNTNSEIKGENSNSKCPAVPLAQEGQLRASPRPASLITMTWRAVQQHRAPHSAQLGLQDFKDRAIDSARSVSFRRYNGNKRSLAQVQHFMFMPTPHFQVLLSIFSVLQWKNQMRCLICFKEEIRER